MWWNADVVLNGAPLALVAVGIISYLLGAIPFGLVFTQLAGFGDIRKIGSGSIGATNVLRTGNKPLALATFIADSGKGGLAVIVAGVLLGPLASVIAGCAAFTGHIYPVWLGFKGGKGMATYFGTLLALAWPIGLMVSATWLAPAFLFRISSLAALISIVAAPIYCVVLGNAWLAVPIAVCSLLVAWRHKSNIERLLNGTEPKFGKSKTPSAPTPPESADE